MALTNGLVWKVYKIIFSKPIDKQLIYEFDLTTLNVKKQNDLEMLYYLSIEAFSNKSKSTLDDFFAQKQILNRYIIGQILLSEPILSATRRAIKKIFTDVRAENDELHMIINNEIIKREVIEGNSALDAKRMIQKAEKKIQQKTKTDNIPDRDDATAEPEELTLQSIQTKAEE